MRRVAGEQHAPAPPLLDPAGLEPVDGVTFQARVVGLRVPWREQPPRGRFVVQLVDRLARKRHELPAAPTGAARHDRGRASGIANLHVDRVEDAWLVEHDVDDQPVVEEGAVDHRHAEQLTHRALRSVARDGVARPHRVRRTDDPERRSARRRRIPFAPVAPEHDDVALVVEGSDVHAAAHLHARELVDARVQHGFEVGLREHRRLRPPRQAVADPTESHQGFARRVPELVDVGGLDDLRARLRDPARLQDARGLVVVVHRGGSPYGSTCRSRTTTRRPR